MLFAAAIMEEFTNSDRNKGIHNSLYRMDSPGILPIRIPIDF